jgi:hypothetical protein
MKNKTREFPHLWNLLLEHVHLVQEEDDGRSHEPLRVDDTAEQDERFGETILYKRVRNIFKSFIRVARLTVVFASNSP